MLWDTLQQGRSPMAQHTLMPCCRLQLSEALRTHPTVQPSSTIPVKVHLVSKNPFPNRGLNPCCPVTRLLKVSSSPVYPGSITEPNLAQEFISEADFSPQWPKPQPHLATYLWLAKLSGLPECTNPSTMNGYIVRTSIFFPTVLQNCDFIFLYLQTQRVASNV